LNTTSTPKSNERDVEAIVDQVWSDLDGRIPRSAICTIVVRLLEKYDDAIIKLYVPLLVRREATVLLRKAVFQETERMQ
jgi:hypothetical protein